jgi:hypothetical protein
MSSSICVLKPFCDFSNDIKEDKWKGNTSEFLKLIHNYRVYYEDIKNNSYNIQTCHCHCRDIQSCCGDCMQWSSCISIILIHLNIRKLYLEKSYDKMEEQFDLVSSYYFASHTAWNNYEIDHCESYYCYVHKVPTLRINILHSSIMAMMIELKAKKGLHNAVKFIKSIRINEFEECMVKFVEKYNEKEKEIEELKKEIEHLKYAPCGYLEAKKDFENFRNLQNK